MDGGALAFVAADAAALGDAVASVFGFAAVPEAYIVLAVLEAAAGFQSAPTVSRRRRCQFRLGRCLVDMFHSLFN